MGFYLETIYDLKTLTVMAKSLRKTIRQKKSRRSHILGFGIITVGMILSLMPNENGVVVDSKSVITWLVIAIMLVALIWEDGINGFFAKKRLLKGTEHCYAHFGDESYITETEIGKTEWNYDKIACIVETKEYFVFVFSNNHAQAHAKTHLTEQDIDQFKRFLENKTNKKVQFIK